LAAAIARPQPEGQGASGLADPDVQELRALWNLGQVPAPSPVAAAGRLGADATPPRQPRPLSSNRPPDGGSAEDDHWLAGVEARFEHPDDVASDAAPRPVLPTAAGREEAADGAPLCMLPAGTMERSDRPAAAAAPSADHWLAGIAAVYERGDRSAPDGPEPVAASSAQSGPSDPETTPAPGDHRPHLGDWLDTLEVAFPAQYRVPDSKGERRTAQADTTPTLAPPTSSPVSGADEPVTGARHADTAASPPSVTQAVSWLEQMEADLVRVGATLDGNDAAFSEVVTRWQPESPAARPIS
jgi:hypothetical protein